MYVYENDPSSYKNETFSKKIQRDLDVLEPLLYYLTIPTSLER